MRKLYRLNPIRELSPTLTLEEGDKKFHVVEVEPAKNKRYIVSLDIGQMPPREAQEYMRIMVQRFKGFFPEGTVLYIPSRDGHPSAAVYELENVDDG